MPNAAARGPSVLLRSLRLTLAVLAVAGLGRAGPGVAPVCLAGSEPPDVLLLGIDTLRGDHLHCTGLDWIQTPHIDALAADGVVFSRCFATAPWTLPSFASIYTGLIPYRHGAIGGEYSRLADERVTLAERLAAAGWATGGFVAIDYLGEEFNMAQGFGTFALRLGEEGAKNGPVITELGREFVDAPPARPFFLHLHYFDVHAPYAPPPPFDRMYYRGDERAGGEPLLSLLRSPANRAINKMGSMYTWLEGVTDIEFPRRQYAAGVSFVDDQVGRVIAHLKERGLYDRTLIVLVSDHGEHLGEHDLYFTHSRPHHEALHVPLILKLPGGSHAGRVVDEAVSVVDVLPTILQAVGLPVPEDLDGRSLIPVLPGQEAGARSVIVAETGSQAGRYDKALIEWPWKLLLLRMGRRWDYRLYDLAADPAELQNLAGRYPDRLAAMQDRLWSLVDRQEMVAGDRQRPAEVDEATRRRLRALGY